MNNRKFSWRRWIPYSFLFIMTAILTLYLFMIITLFTRYFFWLIVPSSLIYGGTILISLCVFLGIFVIARRKHWHWLVAASLGGTSVPGLLLVLMLALPFIGIDPDESQKPNQRQPLTSPGGKYVLTVPRERSKEKQGPIGFGLPFWHVKISDPNRVVLYRDAEESFPGHFSMYWTWDEKDRVWLYDSEGGTVYFYEYVDENWTKQEWGHGKTGYVDRDIEPPLSLYPSYMSAGPVCNLRSPWDPSGLSYSKTPEYRTMVTFRNLETGEFMMLRVGETKNDIEVLDANWEKRETVIRIKSKQFRFQMSGHSISITPYSL
jgi:hypothetical protein